jgi:hypothetical protein
MIARRAGGGNRETVLSQLVGKADPAEGRLLDRQRAMASSIACSTRFFNTGFLQANFLQGQFAALVVELLEPVEAVAAVAHHLAGLADIAAAALFDHPERRRIATDTLIVQNNHRRVLCFI